MFNFKKIGGQMLVLLMTLLCALDVVEAKHTDMAAGAAAGVVAGVAGGVAGPLQAAAASVVANQKQSASAVSGCSSNQGIFSGLIQTGSKVFNGLRDLIYVVAGFGIIGVAVGGFFGNLNWKWLGAIVISLVVIATTGELISAITGCENFTNAMISDTLK